MCNCGCCYPYSYYTPPNYYGYAPYPAYASYSPSYGIPVGYVYASAYAPAVYPGYPRGEHRVGNCLMICQ